MVKGLPAGWGTCSCTVKLDSRPLALTCWKDTTAVSVQSGDIILLNTITGSQMAVLSGHTNQVGSLTFLPDRTSLVSGSDGGTLNLWDIQTCGIIRTFSGHTGCICSVSISADCTTIALGSEDKTVCLWDIQTGNCNYIIREHDQVDQVVFSPTDPQYLMATCQGFTQKWGTNGSRIGVIYNASHTAFSSDGTHFVLCVGKVAVVQNSVSGAIKAMCPPDNNDSDEDFKCSCFSPDGGLIAIIGGVIIYIWDITGLYPCLVKTLIGHTGHVTSITFSPPSSQYLMTNQSSSGRTQL